MKAIGTGATLDGYRYRVQEWLEYRGRATSTVQTALTALTALTVQTAHYGQWNESIMTTTHENPTPFATGDDSALARILATSARAFKFENEGDTVVGVIDSIIVRQVRKYKLNTPVFWDDGRPQEQIVVTIQTDLDETDEDNPEDDGLRAVYIKSWGPQVREFRKAAKPLHRLPAEGDKFAASYAGLSEDVDKTSGEPWKVFVYAIERV